MSQTYDPTAALHARGDSISTLSRRRRSIKALGRRRVFMAAVTIATYAANLDRTRIDPEYRPR